jgi:nucleotide-binding universal stress UspA family protein
VRRVIVGYDDTPASDAALRWAADAADRVGATLLVVHCWTTIYPPADSRTASIDEIEAALLLDRAVEAARQRCGVTVESELRLAEPGRELASIATDGDLLVLGRPRHGTILSGLLGSALNGVLERATVPVVVVPEPISPADAGSAAGRRDRASGSVVDAHSG